MNQSGLSLRPKSQVRMQTEGLQLHPKTGSDEQQTKAAGLS